MHWFWRAMITIVTMIRKAIIALSLLLAVMAVVLWVNSHFRSIYISHSSTNRFIYVFSEVGHIAVSMDDRQGTGSRRWTADWNFPSDGEVTDITFEELCFYRELWGFGYAYAEPERAGRIQTTYILTLPYWFIALFFTTCPAIAFIRSPYIRRKKGLCIKCGYNLTGNVSGVCPECGEKI
jgi:hypothetical protein